MCDWTCDTRGCIQVGNSPTSHVMRLGISHSPRPLIETFEGFELPMVISCGLGETSIDDVPESGPHASWANVDSLSGGE